MARLHHWLQRNHDWSDRLQQHNPEHFTNLAEQHAPDLLWIGCSDGRVTLERMLDTPAGSVFVQRNLGNVFATNDLNCLAVLQYAVEVLQVPDIMVCGHYGCAAIRHALCHHGSTPVDLWTDQIRFAYERFHQDIDQIESLDDRCNRMAEFNVMAQVFNIARNAVVRDAWEHGQQLSIHGVCYRLDEGRLFSVCESINNPQDLARIHEQGFAFTKAMPSQEASTHP